MADIKGKATPEAGAKNVQQQGANCLVAKGTRIEGQFSSADNTRIDGELKGDLKCEKKLVAGETSVIEGKIWAAEAVFMGKITGQVMVSGSVQLSATAVLTGTLQAKTLLVEEGAQLNGDLKIQG
jgi:cytoskeletal protein CcmA (bactofilin family)